MRRSVL
jgi:hypothetical protein